MKFETRSVQGGVDHNQIKQNKMNPLKRVMDDIEAESNPMYKKVKAMMFLVGLVEGPDAAMDFAKGFFEAHEEKLSQQATAPLPRHKCELIMVKTKDEMMQRVAAAEGERVEMGMCLVIPFPDDMIILPKNCMMTTSVHYQAYCVSLPKDAVSNLVDHVMPTDQLLPYEVRVKGTLKQFDLPTFGVILLEPTKTYCWLKDADAIETIAQLASASSAADGGAKKEDVMMFLKKVYADPAAWHSGALKVGIEENAKDQKDVKVDE